jgi:hypothetical protein
LIFLNNNKINCECIHYTLYIIIYILTRIIYYDKIQIHTDLLYF